MSSGNRREDWPSHLAHELEAAYKRPFVWGEHDCCLFAANVVMAMTGIDGAADLRGRYKTRVGAARVIAKHGGLFGVVNEICARHGFIEINPKSAQRGDVVLLENDGAEALGIAAGTRIAAAGPDGLMYVAWSRAITAWRI